MVTSDWNMPDSFDGFRIAYGWNASYLAEHSELRSKNLNKICVKIVKKALK